MSTPDYNGAIAIYEAQIDLLIENHPDCPRWASLEVDHLLLEIERLTQLDEATTSDLSD